MDRYQRLQDILNNTIVKGWQPNLGSTLKDERIIECEVKEGRVWFGSKKGIEIGIWLDLSYHDLFSKDSGLMEFVERKDSKEVEYHIVRLDSNDTSHEYEKAYNTDVNYHYMFIGPMSSEEKIDYVIANIK